VIGRLVVDPRRGTGWPPGIQRTRNQPAFYQQRFVRAADAERGADLRGRPEETANEA